MAINLSQAFNRTAPAPIDGSLVLSKADMLAVNDNLMPEKYFTICTDDGQIYTYDKNATPNAQTGKFSPYSGGSADAGFTPVGTVIAVMGVTAPANYLACNGQVVNIADYPELANYFYQQFGSKNKFGGDGTTTFGIPDLRGEFLRGTGTNGHSNQGNGSDVGTHQDSTKIPRVWSGGAAAIIPKNVAPANVDNNTTKGSECYLINTSENNGYYEYYTSRPTNTSVLYCIATKNIYLNPSNDYSTDEKAVGTWIDGKPIYQKTINFGTLPNADTKLVDMNISNIDRIISYSGLAVSSTGIMTIPNVSIENNLQYAVNLWFTSTQIRIITAFDRSNFTAYITIQYTKTTDA